MKILIVALLAQAAVKVTWIPYNTGLTDLAGTLPGISVLLFYNAFIITLIWAVLGLAVRHGGARVLSALIFADLFCVVLSLKLKLLFSPLMMADVFDIVNAWRVAAAPGRTLAWPDLAIFSDTLVPLVLWKRMGGMRTRCGAMNKRRAAIALLVVIVFVLFDRANPIRYADACEPGYLETMRGKGALYTFFFSGYTYASRFFDEPPGRDEVWKGLERLEERGDVSDGGTFSGKPPNVILVIVEASGSSAVEAPALAGHGSATPFINSLREGSALFSTRVLSPTVGGYTSQCEFEILNSCLAEAKYGPVYTNCMDRPYAGLPAVLKEHGYYAAAFHPFFRHFWSRANAYGRMGFDRYDSEEHFSPGRKIGCGLSDRDFLRQVAVKLRGLPEPYFALVITLSSHMPYVIPEDLKSGISKHVRGAEENLANYLEAVNYADRALKYFWDETEDIRKNSIVIVLGDHAGTTSAGELKRLGYRLNDDFQLQVLVHRVPLAITAPGTGWPLAPVRDVVGDQTDIAPTILHMLGIDKPRHFVGKSLFLPGSTGIGGEDAYRFIMDDKRAAFIVRDKYYDFVKGAECEKEDCLGLLDEASAAMTVSSDIIWGRGYSRE